MIYFYSSVGPNMYLDGLNTFFLSASLLNKITPYLSWPWWRLKAAQAHGEWLLRRCWGEINNGERAGRDRHVVFWQGFKTQQYSSNLALQQDHWDYLSWIDPIWSVLSRCLHCVSHRHPFSCDESEKQPPRAALKHHIREGGRKERLRVCE